MAITRAENQVTWSAANSVSVTANSSQTSDIVTIDATTIKARITLKADNSTTPATDDQIFCWVLESSGDPDGASTDEYSTADHGTFLASLDTSGEDPAIKTVDLPLLQKGLKIYAEGITAVTTINMTVSATITEQKG